MLQIGALWRRRSSPRRPWGTANPRTSIASRDGSPQFESRSRETVLGRRAGWGTKKYPNRAQFPCSGRPHSACRWLARRRSNRQPTRPPDQLARWSRHHSLCPPVGKTRATPAARSSSNGASQAIFGTGRGLGQLFGAETRRASHARAAQPTRGGSRTTSPVLRFFAGPPENSRSSARVEC